MHYLSYPFKFYLIGNSNIKNSPSPYIHNNIFNKISSNLNYDILILDEDKDDGDKVKEKLKNNYNTNDLVYGLSAYLGWGGATLYGKYDLNPIFQDPNRELHNFSLGLRFDVD